MKAAIKRNTVLQQLLKNVIYNKHGIIAINKPYGLTVQGASSSGLSLTDLLDDFAHAQGLATKPQLVHRLDRQSWTKLIGTASANCQNLPPRIRKWLQDLTRDSTGVLLLSRSGQAAQYLAEAFRQNEVKKTYWAITVGAPRSDEGEICIALKETAVNRRYKIVLDKGEHKENEHESSLKPAHTKFKVMANNKATCVLLKLHPITGCKHQLRVHLAQGLGTPILGDHKYSSEKQQPQVLPLRLLQMLGFKGVKNPKTGKRKIQPWQRALIPMHLHAKEIALAGLETNPVIIKAPLPDYFTQTLSCLQLHSFRTCQKISTKQKYNKSLLRLGISTSHQSEF